MIAEALRKSILQAAIQGKLTEQLPEDGDARELLEEIKAEKKRLIQEGKIKKENPLPEITEEEIPFEIPENWCWVRLGNITTKVTDGSHNPPPDSGKGYPVISAQCIDSDRINFDCVNRYTDQSGFEKENPRTDIKCGDIILGIIGGSIGNLARYDFDVKVIAQRSIAIINSLINNDYLYLVLKSPLIQQALNAQKNGTAQGGVYLGYLKQLVIPIPPADVQQRIVIKIRELMAYCDALAKDEAKLDVLQKSFPKKMKDSLLQAAIQGKLTKQLESDGDARELVADIQKEKERLLKEGKIKKEKALPEITEEEIPFEIPENWCWVRLPEIGELARGKSKHRPRNDNILYENGCYPMVQTGDVAQAKRYITTFMTCYNEIGLAQSRLWKKGTLCLTIAANIGDVAILTFDACFPDSIVGFNAFLPINSNEYFLYMLSAYKHYLDNLSRSTAQKNINLEILASIPIPLPPLAEQQRIVERLEQLLPLCDALE
jgi:type I restriction enzyme S subunit